MYNHKVKSNYLKKYKFELLKQWDASLKIIITNRELKLENMIIKFCIQNILNIYSNVSMKKKITRDFFSKLYIYVFKKNELNKNHYKDYFF